MGSRKGVSERPGPMTQNGKGPDSNDRLGVLDSTVNKTISRK